jgi:hypothetical protein
MKGRDHMANYRIRLGSVSLLSTSVLVAGGALAGAAGATTPTASLSSIQTKAAAAITLRVNDLNAAVAKVNADASLGSGAATLVTYLQQDIPGLQALGQKIAANTTPTVAGTDAETIFSHYRVLALVLPGARLAGGSDQLENSEIPKLTALVAKAATYETTADQATLGPLLSDMSAQTTAAANAAAGVASAVLSFTPAQWNANHSVLSSAWASLQAAQGDIAKAKGDAKQIRSDLKAEHSAGATTATTTTTS